VEVTCLKETKGSVLWTRKTLRMPSAHADQCMVNDYLVRQMRKIQTHKPMGAKF
jgi:hypothetical protein